MQSIEAIQMRTAILNAMNEQISAAHARIRYHEAIAAHMALVTAKEYLTRAGV